MVQIFHESPSKFGPSVVTIGTFDGVHMGHQQIIRQVVELARENHLNSLALTFDPLPRQVHRPSPGNKLICTLGDRLLFLAALGLDASWVQHYDLDFAALTPKDFVVKCLVEPLQPRIIVVGKDTRFGAQNSGNIVTLTELGAKYGFAVQVVPDIIDPITSKRWSSSWVRRLLETGNVDQAGYVLGRPHQVRGLVVHGKQRGRQLGFPTANLDAEYVEAIPADGVYAGWVRRAYPHGSNHPTSLEALPAAISVGTSPHFGDVGRTVEAHVLGRSDLNLYGEEIVVQFVHRIRENRAFESLDALLSRMDQDLLETATVLGVPHATRLAPDAVTV
ncbi:bifunctional riboflavin kinase/FAD synthetase [Mobiluncus mulieris]|uniref:Riboflavin biosynthesis protein n=1 Tax=Mobiluncus mulieris TaxID=2052 RepID=A0ABD4TW87_9ACTO|nr:bifunctional riboflavin kinase/FAD synthetase [Mobiluncus mulieris]MCU9969141.1 bifunctional riboflavin kinase/FAD synthetase [Mobiluncus mulieris]MCV0009566.1 bifunctional riboflavin kinase/FAD synthetase [Mobiluncus mulieris]NMW75402.1 bifunctional riboflavin kinase/FAD synthetase [Mobiluncus mulieris]NMX19716.1 bifunctional riboflavin kinase/FAD synthetase [Mobiluncus mulieris]